MSAQGDDSLFFVGSDEDDNIVEVEMNPLPPPNETVEEEQVSEFTDPLQPPSEPLFLAGSDDEVEIMESGKMDVGGDISEISRDIFDRRAKLPSRGVNPKVSRAASVSSVSSAFIPRSSSPATSDYIEERPDPPTNKRRLSSGPPDVPQPFEAAFLGTFLVGNAWSTVRGTGYIKVYLLHYYGVHSSYRPFSLATRFASSETSPIQLVEEKRTRRRLTERRTPRLKVVRSS